MSRPLVLKGTPLALDAYLRPAARFVQALIAVPATAALWWTEQWLWLPVPIALSFLVYELLFWSRGDRPTRLRIDGDHLTLEDPIRGRTLGIRRDEVEVARTSWRRVRGGSEAVVLLADRARPRLAIRFLLPGEPDARPEDVDLDAVDRALGGQGGVLRAVAPLDAVARQRFEDPRGLSRLREWVPAHAWRRTGLRTWTGEAPPLDLFGFHVQEPEGWLVLEGPSFELRRFGTGEVLAAGAWDPTGVGTRIRPVDLLLVADGEPATDRAEVPLIALTLAPGLTLHWAAPEARDLEVRPASPEDLHTHPPEGASLLWHLLRHAPRSRLPEALRRRLEAAGAGLPEPGAR